MNQELQARVEKKIGETLVRLNSQLVYNLEFRRLGCRAGLYNTKTNTLTFDPLYLERHTDHFINQTVPHEVCHLVQTLRYPEKRVHGRNWQALMCKVGLDPKRTCTEYEAVPLRKTKTVPYTCGCRQWDFTARRIKNELVFQLKLLAKNRPVRPRYRCPLCKGSIVPGRKI